MAYICKGNDLVCDPCCDFCWFCVYNKIGTPIRCGRKHDNQFHGDAGTAMISNAENTNRVQCQDRMRLETSLTVF